ncbi:MAG: hypothetical protein AAGF29_08225 [Pseudomonadota bacterium]
MKNVIIAAALALPTYTVSANAGDYGQGVQYGPHRNAVQIQFDEEQYERSHYNSARIVERRFFAKPDFGSSAPDRAHHYHRDAHGHIVADCDYGECRRHKQGTIITMFRHMIGSKKRRKHH